MAALATLGDTLVGEISSKADVDYFLLDVPAGTYLRFERLAGGVNFCLDGADGHYINCFGSNINSQYLYFPVTMEGRYVLRVYRSYPSADYLVIGPYRFLLASEPFVLGPGDPVSPVSTFSSWAPVRIAAGFAGEAYVLSRGSPSAIMRIDPTGAVSTAFADPDLSGGLVVDARGDILVTGREYGAHTIWRVSATGEKTRFARQIATSYTSGMEDISLAVGPDGDVWTGWGATLWRFDYRGRLKQQISMGQGVWSLAVSPAGEPYFASLSGRRGIYRLTPAGPRLVVPDTVGELAFDRDGSLYVGVWNGYGAAYTVHGERDFRWGHVIAFDQTLTAARPVAQVPWLKGMAFMRDVDGHMSSRLLALQDGFGRVVELASAATRPPGWGPKRLRETEFATLRPALLAASYADTVRMAVPNHAPPTDALSWAGDATLLPAGISFSSAGVFHGTPTQSGTFTLSVRGEGAEDAWIADLTIFVGDTSSANDIVDALFARRALSPDLIAYLDELGNHNGRLDVGDFRAYLRAQGQLPSAAP